MPDYGQFCPVSRGAEIFAERWTPLTLRESLNGSQRFSELQIGLPRISRNLLTQRLASLASIGVIERRPAARGRGFTYHLTSAGQELRPVVEALGAWGYRWGGADLPSGRLDPVLLMWLCGSSDGGGRSRSPRALRPRSASTFRDPRDRSGCGSERRAGVLASLVEG